MMRICRDNNAYSFLSLPASLDENFSQSFHRTSCEHHLHPTPPPPPPPHGTGTPLIPTTHTSPPLNPLLTSAEKGFAPVAGTLTGDTISGEGYMGVPLFEDVDLGLMSCTESLGFESSDEISSVDFGVSTTFSCSTTPSTPSSSCSTSSSVFSRSSLAKRWSENRSEFPPPLTTLSENGRRNFVLRSERKDGRLEILKVEIERPEILYASRQNGRLTMHLVRSVPEFEEDEEEFDEEEEEEEEEEAEEEEEDEEEETEDRETMTTAEEKEEEEREWKIPAGGVRRCYQYEYHIEDVWGQQQRRWVTTM